MRIKNILFTTAFVGTLILSACGGSSHTHTWGEATYTWSDDYSTCTAFRVCTKDESHFEEETANSVYEIVTPETVDTDGEGQYVVSFTNEAFVAQTHTVYLPKDKYATKPHFSTYSRKYVQYGLYPQTAINDANLIAALDNLTTPESNGWYFYNGVYYAKQEAMACESTYTFSNGDTIVIHDEYWFECKPISWKVLSNENNQCFLLSELLLDSQAFNASIEERTIEGKTIYPNNYKYSDLRAWLNDDFYNSAFALGKSNILLTTVDNSAASTGNATNDYACDDTEDYVFLPSYKDYTNANYGFNPLIPEYRRCLVTDYALACGAKLEVNSNFAYYFWTRSPFAEYAKNVKNINYTGQFANSSNRVDYHLNGVRPAIMVTIDE